MKTKSKITIGSLSTFLPLILLIVLMTLVRPTQASPAQVAGVRYAKPAATGTGDCSSWANACTLQTALTGAISGDEIWVMTGTHTPTTGSDRTATFQLVSGVGVYGGFAGTETTRDQRDPDTYPTTLSGDLNGDDGPDFANNSDNSYHVVTGSGMDSTTVLDGFTISGGNADGSDPHSSGGGMYNENGDLTISNVTFSGNSAAGGETGSGGGGMYNDGGSPTISNVTFYGNLVTTGGAWVGGGGMYNLSGGSPVLSNVTFSHNDAHGTQGGGHGGGMYSVSGGPVLMNVTFILNESTTGGGLDTYSYPTLTNVTFYGNYAAVGGGMASEGGGPTLTNVTFVANTGTNTGGGIYSEFGINIRNTILWGNSSSDYSSRQIYQSYIGYPHPTISNSVLEGDCPISMYTCTNIIYADFTTPLLGSLIDFGGPGRQVLPLLPDSPAIDAGDDGVCPSSDQRGVLRPQGAHCDIGAYEEGFITIGVAAPLDHGAGYGWDIANAVQLAISQTNAAGGVSVGGITYTLVMTVANSGCNNATMAQEAANDLIAAGAVAVVGPGCSAGTQFAAPVFAAAGVAAITPSASDPTVTQLGYTTTFRTVSHLGGAYSTQATYFYNNLDLHRTALLLRSNLWSDTLADAYADTYTGLGGTITSRQTITATADITPALTAIQTRGAQAIVIPDIAGDVSGAVSRIAESLGMTQTIGVMGPIDGYYLDYAGPAAAGDYGASMEKRPVDMPGYVPFEADYLAANFPNEPEPGTYSPNAYDAAQIIIDAIQRAGTVTDTLAIRDAIAATTNFAGVTGTYVGFDSHGDIIPQWAMVSVVERGEWVLAWINVEVYPLLGGTVDLRNTLGTTTTLRIPPTGGAQTLIPAAAETSAASLMTNYSIIFTTTNAGNPNLVMVEDHAIRLTANAPLTAEMTMTVHYADEDVEGLNESSMRLYSWNGSQWVDAAPCGGYTRDLSNNVLQVGICQLGDYVLLGSTQYEVYLPMIVKDP